MTLVAKKTRQYMSLLHWRSLPIPKLIKERLKKLEMGLLLASASSYGTFEIQQLVTGMIEHVDGNGNYL